MLHVLRSIAFFRDFLAAKSFRAWDSNVRSPAAASAPRFGPARATSALGLDAKQRWTPAAALPRVTQTARARARRRGLCHPVRKCTRARACVRAVRTSTRLRLRAGKPGGPAPDGATAAPTRRCGFGSTRGGARRS